MMMISILLPTFLPEKGIEVTVVTMTVNLLQCQSRKTLIRRLRPRKTNRLRNLSATVGNRLLHVVDVGWNLKWNILKDHGRGRRLYILMAVRLRKSKSMTSENGKRRLVIKSVDLLVGKNNARRTGSTNDKLLRVPAQALPLKILLKARMIRRMWHD
jgi:hypothetical protein